jgi:HSP20 family protein
LIRPLCSPRQSALAAQPDKIEANFKNGVLTITLPKTPEALKKEKKITVKAG